MKAEEWIQKYEEYLIARNFALNTVRAYVTDARMLWEDAMAGKSDDWSSVTLGTATAHLAMLKANSRRETSVARKVYSLKRFFKFLRRSGVVTENPFDEMEFKGMKRTLPRVLTIDEMNQLLNCVRALRGIPQTDIYLTVRDRAMLEVLYSAALRVSELVALDWEDLDLKARQVRVLGKGNKERIVPLGGKALVALFDFKAAYESQWGEKLLTGSVDPDEPIRTGAHPVFITQWKTRMNPRTVPRTIRKWLRKAGILKPVSAHWFRHSAATHMLENGADIRVVQEILGHSSISTTQIYTHISTRRMKAVHANTHPRA